MQRSPDGWRGSPHEAGSLPGTAAGRLPRGMAKRPSRMRDHMTDPLASERARKAAAAKFHGALWENK
ncbi:MAG: hypothetical protein OXH99_01715 [Bryobacterales bacterium]|nr:hypothetical protein [Bryobacterales bacterium]